MGIYKVAPAFQVLLSDEAMPRSPSPMVNENTFLMPWYQIRLVRQLTRVAGMKRARFMDFKVSAHRYALSFPLIAM